MKIIKNIINNNSSLILFCWICAVSVVLFYNYLYSFSFLPITEGWFTVYGKLINEGMLPYKDFYLYLTPFYPLLISKFIGIFGDAFISLRFFGFVITMLITSLLFFILSRRFKPVPSMFASVICMFYYQSGVAYISYDFTQIMTLLTLSSLTMLIIVADIKEKDINANQFKIGIFLLLSGLFAGLTFLTKQSNGALVLIFSGVATLSFIYFNYRSRPKIIIYYLLGVLLPFLFTLIWLISENIFSDFIKQIFTDALSSKGNLNHVLFSWIANAFNNIYFIQMQTVLLWFLKLFFASLITYYVLKKIKIKNDIKYSYIYAISLFSLCIAIIINSYYNFLNVSEKITFYTYHFNNYLISIVLSIILIFLLFFILCFFINRLKSYLNQKDYIIFIFSVGMIFGNGTSAGLSEVGIFLLLAYLFSFLMSSEFFKVPGSLIVLCFGFSLIFTFSSKKFEAPYAWWGVQEPDVRTERSYSNINLLKNIKLSKNTNHRFNLINNILKEYGEEKSIFAFPNIPIMYLLADNFPRSKVIISWFDFLPDRRAKEEASRILNNNPDVIINLLLPEIAWKTHEALFRDNERLGQRDIYDAINELTINQSLYNLELKDTLSDELEIEIWTKK